MKRLLTNFTGRIPFTKSSLDLVQDAYTEILLKLVQNIHLVGNTIITNRYYVIAGASYIGTTNTVSQPGLIYYSGNGILAPELFIIEDFTLVATPANIKLYLTNNTGNTMVRNSNGFLASAVNDRKIKGLLSSAPAPGNSTYIGLYSSLLRLNTVGSIDGTWSLITPWPPVTPIDNVPVVVCDGGFLKYTPFAPIETNAINCDLYLERDRYNNVNLVGSVDLGPNINTSPTGIPHLVYTIADVTLIPITNVILPVQIIIYWRKNGSQDRNNIVGGGQLEIIGLNPTDSNTTDLDQGKIFLRYELTRTITTPTPSNSVYHFHIQGTYWVGDDRSDL